MVVKQLKISAVSGAEEFGGNKAKGLHLTSDRD